LKQTRQKGSFFHNKAGIPWQHTIIFKQMAAFLLLLLPVVAYFLVFYQTLISNTYDTMSQVLRSNDQAVFQTLDNAIDNVKMANIYLLNDGEPEVLSMLWNVQSEQQRAQRIKDLQTRLVWMNQSQEISQGIQVYLMEAGYVVSNKLYRAMTDEDRLRVQTYLQKPNAVLVEDSYAYIPTSLLTADSDMQSAGVLCETQLSSFEISKMLWGSGSQDGRINILYINGEPFLTQNTKTDAIDPVIGDFVLDAAGSEDSVFSQTLLLNEQQYLGTMVKSQKYDIQLVTLHVYASNVSYTAPILPFLPIAIAMFLVIALVFMLWFYRYINRPIIVLSSAFSDLVSGEPRTIKTRKRGDEFSRLYENFNEMTVLLSKKNEQMYLQQHKMRKSEIKQLQSQIDPHFLYNSLFIVKAKIFNQDLDGAMRLTGLLAEYFQFINRNVKDFINLENELSHAHVYTIIQNTRFNGRFDISWEECPKQYLDVIVPRLIVQPLVENAIKYALEQMEGNGLLRLYFEKRKNALAIIIENSGMGVPDKKIAEMNDALDSDATNVHITSTINIHQRIKLFYGNNYGLSFSPSPLGGIKTTFLLDPTRKENS